MESKQHDHLDQIEQSLRLLHGPQSVFEIRALGVPGRGSYKMTASGYFDDARKAASEAAKLSERGAAGVYVTLNRVNPALLARANNRTVERPAATTSDDEVVARQWLFIDIDADRPSGIAATDAEVAAARELAVDIEDHLRALGWPVPLLATSGNGIYLLYRIDAPNTTEVVDTLRKFYTALAAEFNDRDAHIDTAVYNAARIIRVGGTMNRKGDGTDDRPHRLCEYHDPDPDQPVDLVRWELVEAVAAEAPHDQRSDRDQNKPNTGRGWTVPQLLTDHGVEFREKPGRGCTHYLVPCPFDASHGGNGEAAATEKDTGVITFECKHNSCQGRTWHDYKAAIGIPAHRRDDGHSTAAVAPHQSISLRRIIESTDMTSILDQAVAALAGDPDAFQRGGQLVQVVTDGEPPAGIVRPANAPRIAEIKPPRLRELLSRAADWRTERSNGKLYPCLPPTWVVGGVAARGQWSIRRIEGVVEAPVVRADGTVLQTPGFDPSTGLLFASSCKFDPVPDKPSRDDALTAVDALMEVVVDFPFADEAHRAAWLAGVLTPLARWSFHGPAPLLLVDANAPGTGKSLLTDTIGAIVAGGDISRTTLPRDDEEFRKRITALALAAEPLVLIDNVADMLGSATLDAALTATRWQDRILGKSEVVTVPLTTCWYATANNCALGADTARRILHCRLETPEENPEDRSDFQHPDLLGWIRQERHRLAAAAATILSAYFAAGKPKDRLPEWGSFEAWSRIVRQAIVWVDLPDPAATRRELRSQVDHTTAAIRDLMDGWQVLDPDGFGLTVAEVLDAVESLRRGEPPADREAVELISNALTELVETRGRALPTAQAVGMRLHHIRRRVVGGRCFDRKEGRHTRWTVVGAQD